MSDPGDSGTRMTETDLTIKILQGIREDLQRSNRDSNERFDAMRVEQEAARREQEASRREANQRFEVIET